MLRKNVKIHFFLFFYESIHLHKCLINILKDCYCLYEAAPVADLKQCHIMPSNNPTLFPLGGVIQKDSSPMFNCCNTEDRPDLVILQRFFLVKKEKHFSPHKHWLEAVFARKTHTYRYELAQPVTTSSDLRVCGSWRYPFQSKTKPTFC